MFITKREHKKVCAKYEEIVALREGQLENANELIEYLRKSKNLAEILERLAGHQDGLRVQTDDRGTWTLHDSNDVVRLVPDHFGGQVMKHEAHPVTILDKDGKATYALTSRKPVKGCKYVLVRQ